MLSLQLGDAEECPLSSTMAGPDGEATAFLDTTLKLQAVPNHGDKPKSGFAHGTL